MATMNSFKIAFKIERLDGDYVYDPKGNRLGRWFIYTTINKKDYYLHQDGGLKDRCHVWRGNGVHGWYMTRKDARLALAKYKNRYKL